MNNQTNVLRILLVEDDPAHLNTLNLLLSKIPYVQVVAKETCPLAAYDYSRSNPVDVLVTDMVMENMDCVELMKSFEKRPHVIFISGYNDQAARSYDEKVRYWLPKPVAFKKLKDALDELYDLMFTEQPIKANEFLVLAVIAVEDEKREIKRKKHMRFNLAEIAAFSVSGNYVELHSTDGGSYKFRSPLRAILDLINDERFKRVHKSFVINTDHCECLYEYPTQTTTVVKGYKGQIPLSDAGIAIVKALFYDDNKSSVIVDEEPNPE